jgi:dTDP-4-amino-4,6-dideoxygalactose transaminase
MKTIPFNKPFIIGNELRYIRQAVKSEHLSGNGPFTARCHEWLKKTTRARAALLTSSCTDALEMAALLCDLKPGDEVIMPSFTFVSTANAFALRGAVPVFVDVRPDTLNLDEKRVEKAVTKKTRALVAVHYGGVVCEMEPLAKIARRHGLVLIEDAAQALMSTYCGKPAGGLSNLAAVSFHETKNCIAGEGGALLVNDPALLDRAHILWEKGTNRKQFVEGKVDKYTWVDLGSSFLASDLTAAFLYAQFEKAGAITQKRKSLFDRYRTKLAPLEKKGLLRLPVIPGHCKANGHLFYLLTRTPQEREALRRFLNLRGIEAVFHYVPLHSSPAGRRLGRAEGALSVTDTVSARLLRLPLFYELTFAGADRVADTVKEFYCAR